MKCGRGVRNILYSTCTANTLPSKITKGLEASKYEDKYFVL